MRIVRKFKTKEELLSAGIPKCVEELHRIHILSNATTGKQHTKLMKYRDEVYAGLCYWMKDPKPLSNFFNSRGNPKFKFSKK